MPPSPATKLRREINATRQLLGHAAIPFVGQLSGHLEWRGKA
ncbi:MAG: hypothetical protein WD939_01455 [Dehalococcoidia bacterium]